MNGGTPYLIPWPALPFSLNHQLAGKLAAAAGAQAALPGGVGVTAANAAFHHHNSVVVTSHNNNNTYPTHNFHHNLPLAAAAALASPQSYPPQLTFTFSNAAGGGVATHPQFAAPNPAHQMLPMNHHLSLPPTLLTAPSLITTMPKLILPSVKVNFISFLKLAAIAVNMSCRLQSKIVCT